MKTVFAPVSLLSLGLGLSALAACSEAKTPPQPVAKPAAVAPQAPAAAKDAYPLTTCPVSGETLGEMGPAVVKTYDGEEVRFCCKECPPKFEKDLAANLAKVKAAKVAAAAK